MMRCFFGFVAPNGARRVAPTPLLVAVLALVVAADPAAARGCFPIAEHESGGLQLASVTANDAGVWSAAMDTVQAALPDEATVGITYLGHSSFWIETAAGVTAITDYNGYHNGPAVPDIVTMNNAHSTHFTNRPDPAIRHVLRGWNPSGGIAEHDLEEADLRVRNVPTSVHGRSGDQANSNSIFVFEVEDLCIAHLGHLHHVLEDLHLGEIGLIDILMVPVDGSYTIGQELMKQVIDQIGPAVVIPMHYFGPSSLNRFLELMGTDWEIARPDVPTAHFSRLTLPLRQVLVLPPGRF